MQLSKQHQQEEGEVNKDLQIRITSKHCFFYKYFYL
jgi:hypothetical protein